MPKVNPGELCSALQLCSVRQRDGEYMVAVKKFDGTISEIPLDLVANADSYEGRPIKRIYSSGHGFFNEDFTKIFLVVIEKKGHKQIQFTGGSPREDANKDVVTNDNGEIKFHLGKIEENALIRAKNRTGADVIENRNDIPLVDRALIENKTEEGEVYRRLVCLLHYVVKSYEGELQPQIGVEEVVGGGWYDVHDIIERKIENLAPNTDIIVRKALEIVKK